MEWLQSEELVGALVAVLAYAIHRSLKFARLYKASIQYARILAAAIEEVDDRVSAAQSGGNATASDPRLPVTAIKHAVKTTVDEVDNEDLLDTQAEVLASVAEKQAAQAMEDVAHGKRLPRFRKWLRHAWAGENRTGTVARRALKAAVGALLAAA